MATTERPLEGRVAVITGTSRGIGAEIAKSLAQAGCNIIGNHVNPNYEGRQSKVEEVVKASGSLMESILADITEVDGRRALLEAALNHDKGIDYLILNAAGGLEQDKEDGWAEKINIEAQQALVDTFLPYIRPGGKIIYLTSLWAHYYGEAKQPPGYESVARTKHAYEESSRARIPEFDARDVSFGVLCGHVITGTAAYSLFRLGAREYLNELEQTAEGGKFPTAEEMGQAARDMILNPFDQGYIRFVGGQEVQRIEEFKPFKLDRAEIADRLPMYTDKTLLVDEFETIEKDSGIGRFKVRPIDTEGHFGNQYSHIQVMKGVEQTEFAAQVLGLVALAAAGSSEIVPFLRKYGPVDHSKLVFLGDEMVGEARITRRTNDGIVGSCDIKVGNTLVSTVPNIDLGIAPNMRVAERIIRMQRASRAIST